jgi:hypothetical protein
LGFAGGQEHRPRLALARPRPRRPRRQSLWSIAKSLLPAGASDAKIARMVNRLWHLNADRIASGRPDLIAVGLRLRLP